MRPEEFKDINVWEIIVQCGNDGTNEDEMIEDILSGARESFFSTVIVCARSLQIAEVRAMRWVREDQLIPVRVVQAKWICGVMALADEAIDKP